jgi:hypothetical protein
MWRKALVLVALTLSIPGGADATIECPHPLDDLDTLETIPTPGQDGYEAARYARRLYELLQPCLAANDCIALVGELAPKWDKSKPLPHVAAEKEQEERYRTAEGDWRGYSVSFSYSDFYGFAGVQLTAQGPVRIAPDTIDATAGAAEEGFWSFPLQTDGPMLFMAQFVKSDGHLWLTVPGQGFCPNFPLPAPDEVALKLLTACIAKGRCE